MECHPTPHAQAWRSFFRSARDAHRRKASRLGETDLPRPGELSLTGKSRAGPLLLEDRYESTSSLAHKLPIRAIEDNALIRKYKSTFKSPCQGPEGR